MTLCVQLVWWTRPLPLAEVHLVKGEYFPPGYIIIAMSSGKAWPLRALFLYRKFNGCQSVGIAYVCVSNTEMLFRRPKCLLLALSRNMACFKTRKSNRLLCHCDPFEWICNYYTHLTDIHCATDVLFSCELSCDVVFVWSASTVGT